MMFDTFPLRQVVVVVVLVFLLLAGNIAFCQQMLQADAQNPHTQVQNQQRTELKYRGQFSTWGGYASGSEWPVMLGARYLQQLNLEVPINRRTLGGDSGGGFWGGLRFDAELAGNVYGSGEILPFYEGRESWDAKWDGKVKLYRGWGRVSTDKAELRVGLQKINFGSAMMLRPLMWFDSMDPRDPLQMTDGVWGAMGRYYFNNNANVWLWGLLGNSSRRALDVVPSDGGVPEFGGRVQVPVGRGEIAFTFHRRKTDLSGIGGSSVISEIGVGSELGPESENRYGLDMRFDYEIGFWLEGVWINRRGTTNTMSNQSTANSFFESQLPVNQRMVTVGADYTFGLGNGLGVAVEHMWAEGANLSALNVNYPLNMENSLSWMCYSVWGGGGVYNLVRWKRMLSFGDLYVTAFVNPENSALHGFTFPGMGGGVNTLSGNGVQIMLVINHQTK
ncbi:hypothetical protein U5907_09930 [Bacteroidales bacterium MB20-C3-3]|nr:hypothetical protein U5907_09930 [Bacteroidales bacterium MB20-C3-3]